MEQEITWRLDGAIWSRIPCETGCDNRVLPAAEALDYNPAPLLARLAANLEEDRNYLETLTLQAAADCLVDQRLAISVWKTFPPALQNRLLRLFWQQASGSKQDLGFVHIRLLRDWLPSAESGQRLSLPGNRQAILIDGYLQFMGTQSSADCFQQGAILSRPLKINLPGLTPIYPFNQKIAAYLIENDHDIVYNDSTEYFLLDRIRGSVVRHRQPGDRIRPAGRSGGKSLKNFLTSSRFHVTSGTDCCWCQGSRYCLVAGWPSVPTLLPGPGARRSSDCIEISPLATTDM